MCAKFHAFTTKCTISVLFATIRWTKGVSDATIKALGRWKSEAYQVYIKTPKDKLAQFLAGRDWSASTIVMYAYWFVLNSN